VTRNVLGLVIEKAIYGCAVEDDEARDLAIDVTAALQSLVHKSQLYVPGQQTKVCFIYKYLKRFVVRALI
jgi:DnaJ homolog subfamily C member 11